MSISRNSLRQFFVLALVGTFGLYLPWQPAYPRDTAHRIDPARGSDAVLEDAYARRISNLQVAGQGIVAKLLKDDREGRRHQRFLLRLDSGLTLLVAHNIDLAPRIENLHVGDTVSFFGEYEWNAKGGVIHWTHHDPRRRHPDGWLKHDGIMYR